MSYLAGNGSFLEVLVGDGHALLGRLGGERGVPVGVREERRVRDWKWSGRT